MKLVVIPKNTSIIADYIDRGCGGIIVGLKDLSTNYDVALTTEEIKKLKKQYPNIEIFVSINKNIFNDELDELEHSLKELDSIGINGVLFYDLSVLYLRNKNKLKLDLVWNQTHMVTNYNTCNYYHDLGVNYAYLATEITLEEINEIKSKTAMKLFAFAYGYPIMAHTRRTLLTNYFLNRNKKYSNQVCHIYDNNNHFSIKEDQTGTTFLNDEIVNGTCLITDSNVDYIVLSDDLISDEISLELASLVVSLMNTKNERLIGKIEDLIGDNTNFFFKKTIFMVKKNEE